MEKIFDARHEAQEIMEEVLVGYLMGVVAYPEDEHDLALMLSEDAAYILVERQKQHIYSAMEWNATRNALTELIADLTK